MFGLRNQFPEKMQSINDRADEAERDMTETSCISLLSELYTACGEDVCEEPNMDSFQLSVNQVGSSVNTHTKLKVAAIGEFYDFQRLTVMRDDTKQVTNTPLNERRPVRCCRDDEPINEEDIWYKSPIAVSASLADVCPYAWEQKWTSDVAVPAFPVLQTDSIMSPLEIGQNSYSATSNYSPVEDNTWTLEGPSDSGRISDTSDNFLFVNTQATGEIDIRLRVRDYTSTSSDDCAGLMIRESLENNSRHWSLLYCGDKRLRRVRRTTENGDTDSSLEFPESETDVIEGDVEIRITFDDTGDNNFRYWTRSDGSGWTLLVGWGGIAPSGFTRDSNFYVGIGLSRFTFKASEFTIDGAYALPDDMILPATPTVVDGYTSYNQRICKNDNQFLDVDEVEENEDGSIRVSSAQECASYCNDSLDCVSFDFFGNSCRLSASCEHFSMTDPNPASQWYFKNVSPPSYMKYAGRLCTTGSSDLASTNANSVQECANQCSENRDCVSIAYQKTGSTECRLSSTCHEYNDMSDDSGWDTYVKRDEDDDEDEDVCPFLPFAQAEVCSSMSYLRAIVMLNTTDCHLTHSSFVLYRTFF